MEESPGEQSGSSEMSLDMSEVGQSEDQPTDMENEQPITVRTKMANIEKAEEFITRYPGEPMRLRAILNMPEISTTDEVLEEVETILKQIQLYDSQKLRLRDILAHRCKGPDTNLIAIVEDLLIENDYNKIQCQTKDKLIQQLQNEKQNLMDRAPNAKEKPSTENTAYIRKSSSTSGLNQPAITPRMAFKTLRNNNDSRNNQMNLNQIALKSRGKAASPYTKYGSLFQSSMGTKFPEITAEHHQTMKDTNILDLSVEEKPAGNLPAIDSGQKFDDDTPREAEDAESRRDKVRFDAFRMTSATERRPASRVGRRKSTIHWEKFLADMTRASHKNDLTKDRYFHRILLGSEGGCFRIPGLDLVITFPKDAFSVEEDEEEEQEVILGVSWNRQDQPRLKPGQVPLAPVFFCLPHDLSPATPIALSFPHPLQLDNSPSTRPTRKFTEILHSKTQIGEPAAWSPVETLTDPFRSEDQKDSPGLSKTTVVGEVTADRCVLLTTKTGLFTAMAEFKQNQYAAEVKKSMVLMLFATIHFRDGLLHLYIFMVDDLPSCKMAVHKEMEGSLFLGEHPLPVGYNKEIITVTMSDLMEGWKLQSDTTQTIQNKKLWQGGHLSCTYLLKHEVKALQCVLGRLTIYQHATSPDQDNIVAQLPICIDLDQIPSNADKDELINSGASSLFQALDTRWSKKVHSQQRDTPANTPFYNYPSTVESVRRQSSQKWQNKVVHKAKPQTKEISVSSRRLKAMMGKADNPTVWGPNQMSIAEGPEWPYSQSGLPTHQTIYSGQPSGHGAFSRMSQAREWTQPMNPVIEEEPSALNKVTEADVTVFMEEGISQQMKNALGTLLNMPNNSGQDWQHVATKLNLARWIPMLTHATSPTVELLTLCEVNFIPLDQVTQVLQELGREDIQNVILQYNQSTK